MAEGWESWAWSIPSYGSFPVTEAVANSQEWTLSRSIPELRLVGNPVPLSAERLASCILCVLNSLASISFPFLCENWE